jgi:oligopeptide/dipeptide ABC transporter ATP-binding protein
MPLLALENVTRRYPVARGVLRLHAAAVQAVSSVSLAVERGEVLGLVGESGCGKSTLARLILGLEPLDGGTIRFQDRPLPDWDEKDLRRRVQMVFQDPYSSLNPRRTVGSTVAEPLVIHGVGSRAGRRARVAELLALVGLDAEHARRYPHEFSGGQRQRVAIARALALGPELVVCDEPVSALDVSIRAQVLNLLAELRERLRLTYLFISHDLSVVGHVSDRVAVMYLGRIVELAASRELFSRPRHPYTQALLSAAPEPDPEAPCERIRLAGDVPSPLAPPAGCPFHPRCPQAFTPCATRRPELSLLADGRRVACWLHDDARR